MSIENIFSMFMEKIKAAASEEFHQASLLGPDPSEARVSKDILTTYIKENWARSSQNLAMADMHNSVTKGTSTLETEAMQTSEDTRGNETLHGTMAETVSESRVLENIRMAAIKKIGVRVLQNLATANIQNIVTKGSSILEMADTQISEDSRVNVTPHGETVGTISTDISFTEIVTSKPSDYT